MAAYQPDIGDIIYLNFDPQAGTEQAGRRPALVLTPRDFNVATGLLFACPITTKVKGGSFEVPIPAAAGVSGVVLCEQLGSYDWLARNAEFHSQAPPDLLGEVQARIEAALCL